MNKFGFFAAMLILMAGLVIAAEVEQRTIQAEQENITISIPKGWSAIEAHRTPAGKPYYQLGPVDTNFSVQIYLNEPLQSVTNAEKRLEHSLEVNLKPLIAKSVERKVDLVRFGSSKEGVYARLTDSAPKAGEYRYYTRGVRLIGTNVLGFELVSNDQNFSALSNTLALIESVKIGVRNKQK
jgi:hypothetical protein